MCTGSIVSTVLAKNLLHLLDQSLIKNWNSAWHNRLLEERASTYAYTPSSRQFSLPSLSFVYRCTASLFLCNIALFCCFCKALNQITIKRQIAPAAITPSISQGWPHSSSIKVMKIAFKRNALKIRHHHKLKILKWVTKVQFLQLQQFQERKTGNL